MLRTGFQQRELLISASTNFSRQGAIVFPEIPIGTVDHLAARLQGLGPPGFVISQCSTDAVVQASCIKIRLKLCVDRLWAIPVKPVVELFQLAG